MKITLIVSGKQQKSSGAKVAGSNSQLISLCQPGTQLLETNSVCSTGNDSSQGTDRAPESCPAPARARPGLSSLQQHINHDFRQDLCHRQPSSSSVCQSLPPAQHRHIRAEPQRLPGSSPPALWNIPSSGTRQEQDSHPHIHSSPIFVVL